MNSSALHTLPDRARAWVEAHAPQPVVDVAPIGGGMTNTKWLIHLAEGDPLVLRWSDPGVWGETGREHVQLEALACRLLEGSALPVPNLLAVDVDGTNTDGPANLMTWLPRRVRHEPLSPDAITDLARISVQLHGQPVAAENRPPTFTFRGPAQPEVPSWTQRPALWQRAIDRWNAGPPPTPQVLLHRDFHLGNIVWEGDTVTGLVDWAMASWGPADLDVAHACADFAMLHTIEDAETFRAAYVQAGGHLDPDPDAARFWVIADIIGFLPDPAHILASVSGNRPDLTADDIRHGLEDLLALTLG